MNVAPWLSVIMPTYNGERHLKCSLDSIVVQRDPDIEVIVVDDGSTDATLNILKTYSQQLHLSVIRRKHIGNWVANTNLGMSMAKGKYLCWLQQDDIWCPDRLITIKKMLERWPNAKVLIHPSWYINAGGRKIGLLRCPISSTKTRFDSAQIFERLLIQNFLTTAATVFRSDALREIGRMDDKLWYCADWDYWLRLVALKETVYVPTPLALFRIHTESQTCTFSSQIEDLRRQYRTVLNRHIPEPDVKTQRQKNILHTARFSADVNLHLAGALNGGGICVSRLITGFLKLGPLGWYRYFRDSRIFERSFSRILARILS